jgi:hypothetical protein
MSPELLAEELQALAATCRRQFERCVQSPDAGLLRRCTSVLATTGDAAQLAAGVALRSGDESSSLLRPALDLCVASCRASSQLLSTQSDAGLREAATACLAMAELLGGWEAPTTPVPATSRARDRRRVEPSWSTGPRRNGHLVGASG